MPCLHEIYGTEKGVVCARIVDLVRVRCGHAREACAKCTYPKDGDETFIRTMAKRHLYNLLITGNGRTNFADIIDVPAVAARFKAMATEEERKKVVRKAINFHCVLPERHGHPPNKAYANLVELESELGVSGILEEEKIRGPADVETRQWLHDEMLPEKPCRSCGDPRDVPPPCVYRGVREDGTLLCNLSGELVETTIEQCLGCKDREW